MATGYTATLVAATLAISRSSLYYQKRPRSSRADRTYDAQIVMACGEKLAFGYRRVAWWLGRKKGLRVNRKRVLRVMRERGLLVRWRRLRARRKKEWGRVETSEPNHGVIEHVFYPVFPPDRSANDVAAWLAAKAQPKANR